MKAVLISIKPKWVEKIANKEKTIEVRRTRPKIKTPFKCYIYCTIGNGIKGDYLIPSNLQCGKVIGEFVCDWIEEFYEWELTPSKKYYEFEKERLDLFLEQSCLSYDEICKYRKTLPYFKPLYGWHISDLKIYDKPKELSEFRKLKERIERTCGCLSNNGLCNAARYEELCDNIKKCCFKEPNAPQSWCYVEELKEKQK